MAKRATGLSRPVHPDDALGAIVGYRAQPRTQIVKKIWQYIKKHRLQNPTNRRMIDADDVLYPFFNRKNKVNMLDLPGLISDHID